MLAVTIYFKHGWYTEDTVSSLIAIESKYDIRDRDRIIFH